MILKKGVELMAISVIKKRDGRIVPFDVQKISDAIEKSFRADEPDVSHEDLSDVLAWEVYSLLELEGDPAPTVEHVQDIVEQVLMRGGYVQTAKSYILYRQERTNVRNREARGRGTITVPAPEGATTFLEQALAVYRAVRDNGGCELLLGFFTAMAPGVADEFRRQYANELRLALDLTADVKVEETALAAVDEALAAQGLLPSLGENPAYLTKQAELLAPLLGCGPGTVALAQERSAPMAREIIFRRIRRTVDTLLTFLEEAGCAREIIVAGVEDSPEIRLLRDILPG